MAASRRVGRNDPCPCGSGRKYKHCCLRAGADTRPVTELPGPLPSPFEVQPIEPAPAQGHVERWTGMAVDDVAHIVAAPFGTPWLVRFSFGVPAARHALVSVLFAALAEAIGEAGARVRADGSLDRATQSRLSAALRAADADDARGITHVRPERDVGPLRLVRFAAAGAGLLEQAGDRLTLTDRARTLLARDRLEDVYEALLRGLTGLDASAIDGLPETPALVDAWVVVLLLLRRFGAVPLPLRFYGSALCDLFPSVFDDVERSLRAAGADLDGEEWLAAVPELALRLAVTRALLHFAIPFGFADMLPLPADAVADSDDEFALVATDLLDDAVQVRAPQLDPAIFFATEHDDASREDESFVADAPWAGDDIRPFAGDGRPSDGDARPNRARALNHALRDAMAARSFSSLAEAQAFVDRFTEAQNTSPDPDFDGLSPDQMHRLLVRPFDAPDLLRLVDPLLDPVTAPIMVLVQTILDALGERGLKATATGNLPRSLAREAFERYRAAGFGDPLPGSVDQILRETDFGALHTARVVARRAGLLRLTHGRWFSTRAARRLQARGGPAAVYPVLLRAHVERFAWCDGDGFPPLGIIQQSWAYTVLLLHRHGGEPRSTEFYETAFLRAFPLALDEMEASGSWRLPSGGSPAERRALAERRTRDVYGVRALERFAAPFALAVLEDAPGSEQQPWWRRAQTVRAGPALYVAFEFGPD
jgi:hypothetical protein